MCDEKVAVRIPLPLPSVVCLVMGSWSLKAQVLPLLSFHNQARKTIRIPNTGLFPSCAVGLGVGYANTMFFAHVCRVFGLGRLYPCLQCGNWGQSSSAAGIQTSLCTHLCHSTRKTTSRKGRAKVQGLFSRLLGGRKTNSGDVDPEKSCWIC